MVTLGKLKIKNPVILASGTFDRNIAHHIDVAKLGAITTKTVTLEPRVGNPLPHIIKTKFGFLNSVGLKNPGIKKYLVEELPFWRSKKAEILCSIGGEKEADYIRLAKILNQVEINAIEVNVSCPNVSGGLSFAKDCQKLISKIRKVYKRILIVKLSPNVDSIIDAAKSALSGGADILTLVNAFRALAIHPITHRYYFAKKIGGYSGAAIKPMALRYVYEVYNELKCPIIGGGGIASTQDAIDFIQVGAKAIFIGSSNFLDPKTSIKILNGLKKKRICL